MNNVILSANDTLEYAALLPLTATLWSRAGYQPQVILVGDQWHQPNHQVILHALEQMSGAIVHYLPHYRGYRSSTIAQVARLYPHRLPGIRAADKFITSDVDMWPMDLEYFRVNARFTLWRFAGLPKFYMCYAAGDAYQWGELMGHRSSPAVGLGFLGELASAEQAWNFDEQLLNHAIGQRLPENPTRFHIVDRPTVNGLALGRIDRSKWELPASLDGVIDAHIPRSAAGLDHWEQIFPLFTRLAPDRSHWAKEYFDRYTKDASVQA